MQRPAKSAKKADWIAYVDHLEAVANAAQASPEGDTTQLEFDLDAARRHIKQLQRIIRGIG